MLYCGLRMRHFAQRWQRVLFASRRQCLSRSSNHARPTPESTKKACGGATQKRLVGSSGYSRILQSPTLQALSNVGPIRLLKWFAGVFLLSHIFTCYFFSVNSTWGISMLPTLNSCGDYVLISKYYRRGRGIQVGDLVSFSHPADESVEAVKRVVGLEGDFVAMGPSFMANDGTTVGRGKDATMLQVPQGHCWVVGDNLKHSHDSRLFGPLPLALIRGKITARWTPWFSLQWMGNGLHRAAPDDGVD